MQKFDSDGVHAGLTFGGSGTQVGKMHRPDEIAIGDEDRAARRGGPVWR